jgi:hypothetical protein
MNQAPLTLSQVRNLVDGTWDEVAHWFTAKPGIFTLPRPEQQLTFELADRLRRAIRHLVGNHNWDRLYFDSTTVTLERAPIPLDGRRPPIYIDTRQLFGLPSHGTREATTPDLAISVQVLRAATDLLELDEDGKPRKQSYLPASVRLQGWLLEEHVNHLETLSASACEGFLFVVYSNDARRQTPVDAREVASWASWHRPSETLWWTSRHFRAKPRG